MVTPWFLFNLTWSEERTKGFVQQEERMMLFTRSPLNVNKVARKVFPGPLAFDEVSLCLEACRRSWTNSEALCWIWAKEPTMAAAWARLFALGGMILLAGDWQLKRNPNFMDPRLGFLLTMLHIGVYPQIIHFNRVFHYKPSILGYHYYFWKHQY